jgi:hypothetical protein
MEALGRFKLRGELGTGSYAVAYDAQDGGTRCVVKVLKDEILPSEPGRRAGLARALEGLKSIEHPSAVKILDSGEKDGKLFVASEFMGCPTLEQKLQQQKRLAEQQAVLYIRQSAQALDKARDVGYCHGDLTSRNVFVVSPEKVKLSDFAIKSLILEPPDIAEFEQAGGEEGAGAAQDEWVTAEDLLRTKGKKASKLKLDDDFVGLAVLMMQMLGVGVPARPDDEPLRSYRENLMRRSYAQMTAPSAGISVHVAEVVRRLLTPAGFDSPGEVVVELASAMLLGRTFGRPRVEAAAKPVSPSAETAQVSRALAEATEEVAAPALGVPVPSPGAVAEPAEIGADVSTFFVWSDRRGGRFFVLHDGERITLGRDPDTCDVHLMDPAVSRKHCSLSKEGGIITVADAGSSNGTFVNEQRVQKTELRPSDRLRIGTTRLYMSLPGKQK